MKLTFNNFKKLLFESISSVYDAYEDILCDIFDVDDISKITPKAYQQILDDYENNMLNEHDSSMLESAEKLVWKAANKDGYNIIAHHGTKHKFSEFKYGDIGFHLGTLDQAKIAVSWHEEDADKKTIYLNTAISLHNPLVINYDLGDWHPEEIFSGAYSELVRYIDDEESMHPLWNKNKIYDNVSKKLQQKKMGKYWSSDSVAQLYFLFNELGFSIQEIKDINLLSKDISKNKIIEKLKAKKYDGIKYLNFYEVSSAHKGKEYSYIVFDANQIKNCEVISFKDGKIIPLENRFNKNTNNLFETI